MPKRDAGNLNETNVRSSGSMMADEAEAGLPVAPSTGQSMLPDLKLYDFAPDGGVWDGRAGGKAPGTPVEITERGGSKDGGLEEATAALGQFGAGIKVAHDQTSLLNVPKGDKGEKVDIPSESNLNSANQRVGA